MHPNQELLNSFYTAFQQRDHEAMAACYHPEVVFDDPAFSDLHGWKAACMWRMLCERGTDLKIEFRDLEADDHRGSGYWEAWYTFSQSGLPVHNKIKARFEFRDGKIVRHQDSFDFRAWLGMALGGKGKLLGWLPPFQNVVKKKAMTSLDIYIAKNKLGPADFANGGSDG